MIDFYLDKMEDVCRTCLSSSAKLFPMESDAGLLEKIEILTSVQISSDTDEYPSTICEGCIENLNKFYCFREIVINADKTLKEKYSISFPTVKKRKATSRKRNYDESRKHRKLNIKALIREKSANVQQKECETAISIKQEPIGFDDPLSCGEDATACEDDNADIKLEIENIIINNKIEASELTEENCKLRQCEECNLTFTSYSTLSNHKRNMHSAPGICTICGVVVRADNLKKHMLVHSEEPVTCKICNRVLKNTGSLRGHLLIHKGETYTCDMCGRCFRVKSEYHRHMRKHDDPNLRKVMCTLCGKCVRDLKRHVLTHTGERPFICLNCKKGFTSTYALKVHSRQHTNEKPFICEYCSMGFNQKVSLMTHLKSKHSIENE